MPLTDAVDDDLFRFLRSGDQEGESGPLLAALLKSAGKQLFAPFKPFIPTHGYYAGNSSLLLQNALGAGGALTEAAERLIATGRWTFPVMRPAWSLPNKKREKTTEVFASKNGGRLFAIASNGKVLVLSWADGSVLETISQKNALLVGEVSAGVWVLDRAGKVSVGQKALFELGKDVTLAAGYVTPTGFVANGRTEDGARTFLGIASEARAVLLEPNAEFMVVDDLVVLSEEEAVVRYRASTEDAMLGKLDLRTGAIHPLSLPGSGRSEDMACVTGRLHVADSHEGRWYALEEDGHTWGPSDLDKNVILRLIEMGDDFSVTWGQGYLFRFSDGRSAAYAGTGEPSMRPTRDRHCMVRGPQGRWGFIGGTGLVIVAPAAAPSARTSENAVTLDWVRPKTELLFEADDWDGLGSFRVTIEAAEAGLTFVVSGPSEGDDDSTLTFAAEALESASTLAVFSQHGVCPSFADPAVEPIRSETPPFLLCRKVFARLLEGTDTEYKSAWLGANDDDAMPLTRIGAGVANLEVDGQEVAVSVLRACGGEGEVELTVLNDPRWPLVLERKDGGDCFSLLKSVRMPGRSG